jgi:amino acid transporter
MTLASRSFLSSGVSKHQSMFVHSIVGSISFSVLTISICSSSSSYSYSSYSSSSTRFSFLFLCSFFPFNMSFFRLVCAGFVDLLILILHLTTIYLLSYNHYIRYSGRSGDTHNYSSSSSHSDLIFKIPNNYCITKRCAS